MKTLKTEKNNLLKWIVIILICYLLASYGANGVINPGYYFKKGQIEAVDVKYSDEYVVIELPNDGKQYSYLNIELENINVFSAATDVIYNYQLAGESKETLELCYMINSYKITDLGNEVSNLVFRKESLDEYNILIDRVYLSEQKQVEILKMIELFISFVGLFCFYVFMQWIKKRYAK